MVSLRDVANILWVYRRVLTVVLVPLMVLPLPLVIQDDAATCGYILIVMAVFWCTEIIPIPVTGMIPVFFMPLAGLINTDEVSRLYYKEVMMLCTGSIMVAIALENANLHKRIALGILVLVGSRPKWLLLGFMFPTFFLSMWIANTATTAMMLPIMEAVLAQLEDTLDVKAESDVPDGNTNFAYQERDEYEATCVITANSAFGNTDVEYAKYKSTSLSSSDAKQNYDCPEEYGTRSSYRLPTDDRKDSLKSGIDLSEKRRKALQRLCKGFTLSICYSASIGGTASLTGTAANVIMKGHADEVWMSHGYATSPVNFASWIVFAMPTACINFVLLYLWLATYFLGFGETFGCCKQERNLEEEAKISKVIRAEFEKLGKVKYAEWVAGLALTAMIFLWFFRSPGFMPGWADLPIFKPGIGDAVPAIMVAVALFIIPKTRPGCGTKANATPLLNWDSVHQRHPWDMIFLMGGGFAIAEACETSGLSHWIGELLLVFQYLPGWAMIFIICLIVAIWTEFTSNAATCTLLMPIMSSMADSLCVNPLYLMFPVAISTSYAFMLPVATQPNALAFSYGRLRVMDMVRGGAILNILCVLTVTLATETWGHAYFDFYQSPWCNATLV